MEFPRRRRDKQQPGARLRPQAWQGPGRHYACEVLEERRLLSVTPLTDPTATAMATPNVAGYANGGVAAPLATGSSSVVGFTPAQISHAYGFDQIKYLNGTIQGDGSGQTVAVIVAFDNPNIASDVSNFSTQFGLPQFNVAGGPTFKKVSQTGGSTVGMSTDPGFALETALDVEWVHALAPKASILLVEATDASFSNLIFGAVGYARTQPGVSVVTMSFGGVEWAGETSFDSTFTTPSGHTGISYFAAAGDGGAPGTYPAYSPNVVGVGGTSIVLDGSNNILSETTWSNQYGSTGGGLSTVEPQPSFQTGVVTQSSTQRAMPDVSFDGDPGSGVAVYDSFNYGSGTPWVKVGGTSFAAPAWGALVAVADQGRHLAGLNTLDSPTLLSTLYTLPAADFNDITSGGNGTYSAGPGYDLVTGRGSPIGNLVAAGLIGSSSITGQVFSDTNGNGNVDGGETGLSTWTAYQDTNNNSAYDAPVTNSFVGPSVALNHSTTVTSNIVVPAQTGRILDINVTINSTFSLADNNLVFTLIAPDGVTQIPLSTNISNGNFTATVFDDSAALAIGTAGLAGVSGSYQPSTALALLNGTSATGTWKLQIANNNVLTNRNGTLTSWTLSLSTGDPSTTTNSSGVYQFTNLAAGTYKVGEVVQGTYTQTSPVGNFYNVNLGASSNVTGRNFGNLPPASIAPSGVTLQAASDSGSSGSDAVTNVNHALQFLVSGTVAGASVGVYVDGNLVGSAVASGTSTSVSTNAVSIFADGPHSVTARQTLPNHSLSPPTSPALTVLIDTTAPVASIVPVSPNPSTSSVAQMTVTFSESVSGLVLSNFQLTRDGGANLLGGGQSVATSDGGTTWILSGLSTLTNVGGSYELDLVAAAAPISDLAGNQDTTTISSTFAVDLLSPLVDLNGAASGTGFSTNWTTSAGTAVLLTDPTATISDSDSANLSALSAVLNNPQAGDVLAVNTSGTAISASFNGTTLSLSGIDTKANYQQVLRTLTFNTTSPVHRSASVNVSASDDAGLQGPVAVATVNVDPQSPTVDLNGPGSGGTGFDTSWNNAGSVHVTDLTATVTDPDSALLSSTLVTITNPSAGDALSATAGGGVGVIGNGTATLTLTGSASAAAYSAVLRSVLFNSSTTSSRTVTVNVISTDDGSFAGNTAVATIQITTPNSSPVVDLNGGTAGTGFTSVWNGSTAVNIADSSNATVTDADGGNLASLSVKLNSPAAGDLLAANTTGTSISQSFSAGTLILSGSDTIAHYQQVLRSVTYANTSGGPGASVVTANVSANDGIVDSAVAVATINIPPTLSLTVGAGAPNFTTSWYNSGAVPIVNNVQASVSAASGVANLTRLTVALATFQAGDVLSVPILTGVSLTSSYSAGTLTLSGSDSLAHYQQELRYINYTNTAGGPGVASKLATFVVSDGTLTSTPVTATININVASGEVLGNRLFYNNSKYDGGAGSGNAAINANDDLAIASDKTGYKGTGTATFANVSAFSKGITGIMVDLASGLGNHSLINLTSGDVTFKVAPTTFVTTTYNQLSTWTAAPTPTAISVRLGAGVGGSDRLEITWAAGAIKNTWLEVDVHAGGKTGLSADDVFYFGSAVGNSGTGDTASLSKVDVTDYIAANNNIVGLTTPVWNLVDYTKDGKVDITDSNAAINNVFTLHYLGSPSGPFAPDSGGGSAAPAAAPANTAVEGAAPVSISAASISTVSPSTGPVAPVQPAASAIFSVPQGAPTAVLDTSHSTHVAAAHESLFPSIVSGLAANSADQRGAAAAAWNSIDEHLLDLLVIGRRQQSSRRS